MDDHTGTRLGDRRLFVFELADRIGFNREHLILGGYHLGSNPWKHLSASETMQKAQTKVAAYVEAGFTKIHLDASMSCSDEPFPLPTRTVAARATTLATTAERRANGRVLAYIIATKVPVPGGRPNM